MSSGTQVDLDWAGVDPTSPQSGHVGRGPASTNVPNAAGAGDGAYLTDEEILGMAPVGQTLLSVPEDAAREGATTQYDSKDATASPSRLDGQAGVPVLPDAMPQWMKTLAADPKHGAEA